MLREVHDWLGRICEIERPPENVVAFNIGLFETADGYSAYLIGAEVFDLSDDDWACNEVFSPSERYCPIPANDDGWKEFQ